MEIPLTALSTLTGLVVMSMARIFIGRRIRQNKVAVSQPVRLLNKFFFQMSLFFFFMTLPYIWLYTEPSLFSPLMAWGYTVGHIFLYIACTHIIRMTVTIIPQLSGKDRLVMVAGVVANIILTILTAATMIYGTQPIYDYERHITQFNAAPIVGISIGIFAGVAMIPPALLFLYRAIKSKGNGRVRPLLLGVGFLLMAIAGPLHDTAQNWQTFVIADIFTIAAIALLGFGIVYRLEQNLAIAKSTSSSMKPLTQ